MPANPVPGKCYVRCTTLEVHVKETVILKTVLATFAAFPKSVIHSVSLSRSVCIPVVVNNGQEIGMVNVYEVVLKAIQKT